MIKYSYADVKKTLTKVGLKKGQTIFLCPEIYKFGEINNVNNKVDYFKIFLGKERKSPTFSFMPHLQ